MDMYDRIDKLLKQKNMTRKAMCKVANINYGTLTSFYHRRSKSIRLDTLKAIAKFLDVSVDWILQGYEINEKEESIRQDQTVSKDVDRMDLEIMRIVRTLTMKGKTILLAYAYGLEGKEVQNE